MTHKFTVMVDPELEPLIPGFLSNRQQDVEQLIQAVDAEEFATVQSIGHGLKGVGGGYGFDRITEIGADIESAAKAGDVAALQDLITSLQEYLGSVEVVYQ